MGKKISGSGKSGQGNPCPPSPRWLTLPVQAGEWFFRPEEIRGEVPGLSLSLFPGNSRMTNARLPGASPKRGESAEAPCPRCGGAGWAVSPEGTLFLCDCGAMERRRGGERHASARIPERYSKKRLSTFDASNKLREAILQDARRYVEGFTLQGDYGLMIRGVTGSGKTHIALGILHEVIERGFSGLYCNVPDLLARLRSSYDPDSDEAESEIIEECRACDLLVLDDLGSESTSDWVLDRLYLIINRRYESLRPVIVTTNCNEEQLREKVGRRITSRLYEMCRPFARFPDVDYRQEQLR